MDEPVSREAAVIYWQERCAELTIEMQKQIAVLTDERDAAEARAAQAEAGRLKWRVWAKFVYLGGGAVSGTDDELRRRVCLAQDKRDIDLAALLADPEQP